LEPNSQSLEGIGSIMREIMFGLAVALHSNRTLIWGLDVPWMFHRSKSVWSLPSRQSIKIGGYEFNCSNAHEKRGGAFNCFFEDLSSCSMEDISPQELSEFSVNPYDDLSRIALTEVRKAIALYHPPYGIFNQIEKRLNVDIKSLKVQKAQMWSSVVAAYAFRLKPYLIDGFTQSIKNRFGLQMKLKIKDVKLWGIHVRHGDVKEDRETYSYKDIFNFTDYFSGLRDLTQVRPMN
jgi:hypothetical protein